MPVIAAQSPITFAAIDVIGATVVTTWNSAPESDPESAEESSLPHAAATSARAAVAASTRRTGGFEGMVEDMIGHLSCELVAGTVELEIRPDQGFRALSGTHPQP
jgi:hypothetical protein